MLLLKHQPLRPKFITMKGYLKFGLFYLLCFGQTFFNDCKAQDSTYVGIDEIIELEHVHWVAQIPKIDEEGQKLKKGWFKRFLFGGNDVPEIQKPVWCVPVNAEETIVLDQGNSTIFIVDEDDLDVPKIVRKQNGKFSSLVSGCLLPNKDLLFVDSRLSEIYRLSANRKEITLFNKSPLVQPTGIAFNEKTSELWIVETASHRVSIFDLEGNRIRTFGERGTGEGEFNYPTSICTDNNGNVYVVDTLNYRIQIFKADGTYVSQFGENGNGTGYLAAPKGIAVDSYGHIYIVDALFHGVQIFDVEGNYLYQFGEQGRGAGQFWMPSGIFIDKKNTIYVADGYNSRIQLFELELIK